MADPMRIRVTLQDNVADVKVLIFHPMETGLRKDPVSGQIVPLHFIKRVHATHNGRTVLDAQWSQAVSRNPFLNFRVTGAKPGDRIAITWEDNRGDTATIEAKAG
ncbi:MAG TPA: thiosulfate oxidation carrier complex protein SoxZ [Burkholderiales bacterium]|nr:thiosulfate oxidation carrier complex protein SoxZ [Burkholderiales bacterium]